MTQKFPIGSQWKTKGGWRAVVVNRGREGNLYVFHHHNKNDLYWHDCEGARNDDNFNLIEPWSEPRTIDIKIAVDFNNKFIMVNYPEDYECDIEDGEPISHDKAFRTITFTEDKP